VHSKIIHIQLCILCEAVDLILQLQDQGSQGIVYCSLRHQLLLLVYRVINNSITAILECRLSWDSTKKSDLLKMKVCKYIERPYSYLQYSQRHSMINHRDNCITRLGDLDISFVITSIKDIFKISYRFRVLFTIIIQKTYQNK
jgi:hypothetical protein